MSAAPARGAAPSDDQVAGLVQRARGGDQEAFGELYRLHVDRVQRCLQARWGVPPADAEDLATEVFVTAMRAIAGYRGEGTFMAWLIGIAWHKALGHFGRRQRREVELPERWPGAGLPGGAQDAEAVALDRLEAAALLASLPTRQRQALALQHLHDLPAAAVARAMGTKVTTVTTAVSLARARLRAASDGPRARRRTPAPVLGPALCACGCGRWLPAGRPRYQTCASKACNDRLWSRRRQARQQARLLGGPAADPATARVLGLIQAAGEDGVTRRDLNRRARLYSARLDRIVELLVSRGQVRACSDREAHSCRPIARYRALTVRREAA